LAFSFSFSSSSSSSSSLFSPFQWTASLTNNFQQVTCDEHEHEHEYEVYTMHISFLIFPKSQNLWRRSVPMYCISSISISFVCHRLEIACPLVRKQVSCLLMTSLSTCLSLTTEDTLLP
jgi:hypothetical protein